MLYCVHNGFLGFYDAIILQPLKRMFRHGPSVGSIGFWDGKTDTQICSHISGFTENFWEMHKKDCSIMVEKRMHSFIISIETMIHMYFLFIIMRFVIQIMFMFSIEIAKSSMFWVRKNSRKLAVEQCNCSTMCSILQSQR
jgi:hypothetical protein